MPFLRALRVPGRLVVVRHVQRHRQEIKRPAEPEAAEDRIGEWEDANCDFPDDATDGEDAMDDDPFANPDGGPLSRIEAKLDKMMAEKAAEGDENTVKQFDAPSSPGGSSKEGNPSQPPIITASTLVNGNENEVSDVVATSL